MPVVIADALTEAQQAEFVIKDNVSFGEWEWDTLANEWDANDLSAWGLDVPPVDVEVTVGLTDPDDVPDAPAEPITKRGDRIVLGRHTLVCGDSTDAGAWDGIGDPSAAMVFTSPPYGIGENAKIRDKYVKGAPNRKSLYDGHDDRPDEWAQLMRDWTAMAVTHAACVVCNVQMVATNKRAVAHYLAEFADHLIDVAVWDKSHGPPQMQAKVLTNAFEWMIILGPDGASRALPFASFHGTESNVVRVGKQHNNEFADQHRATMPVDLAAWAIRVIGSTATTIIDPFGGTGTTLIAAEMAGKASYTIELSPAYCDVIVRRWEEFTGQKAVRPTP